MGERAGELRRDRAGRRERDPEKEITRQRNAHNYRGRERKRGRGGVTDKEIKPEVDSDTEKEEAGREIQSERGRE